jgi:hypothetical protein
MLCRPDLGDLWLRARRFLAAHRASRIAPSLDLGEASALCVEQKQPPDERFAVSRY